ncbi:unnamed protein product [Boreogadus saida]
MKIFRRTPSVKHDNENQLFCYSCKVPWEKEFSWGQTAQKLTLTSDHSTKERGRERGEEEEEEERERRVVCIERRHRMGLLSKSRAFVVKHLLVGLRHNHRITMNEMMTSERLSSAETLGGDRTSLFSPRSGTSRDHFILHARLHVNGQESCE